MEILLLGISSHNLGYFSRVGRKRCCWPSEMPELWRVGSSPDSVRVRFLLLTTVSGTLTCCGCAGGLWTLGIWDYNGRGAVQILPKRRCLRRTSHAQHVPSPMPGRTQLEPQLILPLSVWSSLASNREGAIRTLGLFIMVSEQAQLSSLHIYYITPTEESRACLQIEVRQGIRGRGHKRGVSAISR